MASLIIKDGIKLTQAQYREVRRWWLDAGTDVTVSRPNDDNTVYVSGSDLAEGEEGHWLDPEGFALFPTLGGGTTRCRIEDI